MKNKALEYLNKNKLLYMGMIESIRRNTSDILYAKNDGVLIRERNSNVYMICADNFEKGRDMIKHLNCVNVIVAHEKELADYIQDKFNLNERLECVQAVYLNRKSIDINNEIYIEKLKQEHIDILLEHYNLLSREELAELLKKEHIFGGYKNGVLIGFIGIHLEGSIGLLEIFPQYRRSGYGTVLESFLINYMLKKNFVPFAQIEIKNEKSLLLQKNLG